MIPKAFNVHCKQGHTNPLLSHQGSVLRQRYSAQQITRLPVAHVGRTVTDRLVLDSRVVDVLRLSNLILVTLSSSKPFFFNGLKKVLPFSDNVGA